jgi:putative transcriptional regulator
MIDQAQGIAAGDVIIAPPRMQDSRFHKSVIMITHHAASATFGLCLNKASAHSMKDLSIELDCELPYDVPLYWGGPVNPQTIWMLHSREWSLGSTQEVNQYWSMTSNVEMFHHIADNDTPRHWRLTFGFCGWAQGQLEAELRGTGAFNRDSSWLTWSRPDTSRLLDVAPEELWRISTEQSARQAVSGWMV